MPDAKSVQKIEKRIFHKTGKAIQEFGMISNGDKILVAVSGGKDSWVLLYVLNELKKRAPVNFELIAVNIDQGYQGFRQDLIEEYINKSGITQKMEFFDIASLVDEKIQDGSVPCSLCSRLRRGALYGAAKKLGCTKIALGHHQDDFIETLLLNTFFIGTLAAMAPVLKPDEENCHVIRPLVYVSESDIKIYTKAKNFPVVCCECPLMCGESMHVDHKRRYIKKLLLQLEKEIPDIKNSILASLGNIKGSHLLDKNIFDFLNLNPPRPKEKSSPIVDNILSSFDGLL